MGFERTRRVRAVAAALLMGAGGCSAGEEASPISETETPAVEAAPTGGTAGDSDTDRDSKERAVR